jgi:putative acyl-CoA dehydrogenase
VEILDPPSRAPSATHDVQNQAPVLAGYDVYANDAVLRAGVLAGDAAWADAPLRELGVLAGGAEAQAWGFEANRYPPELRTFDRFGNRIDEVAYHPSYHRLMEVATARGLHASSWSDSRPGAQVARLAGFFVWSQVESGHGCPISMTHAAVPALRASQRLAAEWEPLLFARRYDGALRPAHEKGSALFGMAMTEKQGGSDVRANTTRAVPLGGDEYALTGHKWFCSAPMSDAFLVLAQAPAGLSCFLVPRVLPDGTRNAFALQRLKDKLGNRSNASSEVEFDGTWARLLGEEGRGLQTILEMVNFTRLDCIAGSAAGMRQATAQAVHHASHRAAFGRLLVEQPLMLNVLADLALESEAATLLMLRLARACDRAPDDPHEARLKRIGTAVGKYWICKRAAPHAAEALECLGGNGYVEESIMPRLYREAPLNSIWEGSGNVNALDVLRAMTKEPGVLEAFFAEVSAAKGADARFDAAVARLEAELRQRDELEARARRVVEQMALVLCGALVLRQSPPAVADAYCASRLDAAAGRSFGTLPAGLDFRAIVYRARPV